MKINSEKLYDFINNLGTDEKVRFKVFYDDNYVTEIYWDGENFRWEPGTFTTGALFNPLYDFVEVEEEKKIPEKLKSLNNVGNVPNLVEFADKQQLNNHLIKDKLNEVIDYLDYLKSKGE